jgi:hypothetical protein
VPSCAGFFGPSEISFGVGYIFVASTPHLGPIFVPPIDFFCLVFQKHYRDRPSKPWRSQKAVEAAEEAVFGNFVFVIGKILAFLANFGFL